MNENESPYAILKVFPVLNDYLEVAERLRGGRWRRDELLRLFVVVVPRLVHLGARLRLNATDAHGIVGSFEAAGIDSLLKYSRVQVDFATKRSSGQKWIFH